jgi:CCR4-NOT transcription complex subunit 3
MESLLVGKKKRLDKDKQEKLDELKARVERHRFHIRKLETVLRMLDNMSVEVKKVLLTIMSIIYLFLMSLFIDSNDKR